jgi:hypothetical protein
MIAAPMGAFGALIRIRYFYDMAVASAFAGAVTPFRCNHQTCARKSVFA